MAIYSTPLLTPDGLPSMVSGIEMYLAECRNRSGGVGAYESASDPDFKAATVLVNFSVDDADRAALWPLLHALSFARCSTAVFGGTDWPQRLQERLKPVEAEFVSAVVFVGSQTDLVAESIQAAIDALQQSLWSKLKMLVVVSAASENLAALTGVAGFIRGAQATNGETARQVLLTLAILAAPHTLTPIDAEDLMPVFGPARAPTVLAEAIWLRDGEGRLVYLSSADELAVRDANYIVVNPFMQGMRLSETRGVMQAIREAATATDSVIIHAPCDAVRPDVHSERAGLVLILCTQH